MRLFFLDRVFLLRAVEPVLDFVFLLSPRFFFDNLDFNCDLHFDFFPTVPAGCFFEVANASNLSRSFLDSLLFKVLEIVLDPFFLRLASALFLE